MASELDLIVKGGTVVLGSGRFRVAVGVKDGVVAALARSASPAPWRRRG